jgi:dihydroxyacetone kinase
VEMVIVGEDCALPPPRGLAGRRGLAGTLLCLKVAGAAAAAGLPLAAVLAETIAAAQAVGTMGVALTSCTLPGCAPSMRIPSGEMVRAHRAPSQSARAREKSPCVVHTDGRTPRPANTSSSAKTHQPVGLLGLLCGDAQELGLGIHGEPGAFKGPLRPADEVVKSILDTIMSTESGYLPLQSGEPVALLVNSLGATPPMELSVITHSALRYLKALERAPNVARVYTGMFMTSLDMVGFSLTLMRLPADRAARLDAPHSAPAWPALPQVYDATKAPLPMVNVASHDVVSAEPPTTPMGITLQVPPTSPSAPLPDRGWCLQPATTPACGDPTTLRCSLSSLLGAS